MGRPTALACALALLAGGVAAAALLAPGSDAGTTTTTPGATVPAATTTVAAPPAVTNVSTAPSVVAFTGHGYGHGLGLSQWGAYGYASHGMTYDRILAHYYVGTTLGSLPGRSVRVLVASRAKLTLSATAAWTLVDGTGARTALAPGSLTLDGTLTVDGTPRSAPLTFASRQPIAVGGTAYRGKIVVVPDGKLLDAVDVVGLEQYLKGVVPAEMPTAWPAEALKAQAVAARTYALANLAKGRPFDLYGDTRSQVYGGVPAESPAASAAVDATKGRVVLYHGKVADTLFFASSGGRTASALESTGIDVPYLVPVADPYDVLSPYHDWGPVLYDAAAVVKQLKLAAPIASVSVADGPSGRVTSMVVATDDDARVTLTGNQVRSALGLRSTWFTLSLLTLLPATRTMTFGGAVTLQGSVTGASPVTLEAKPAGGAWAPAGALVPGADGSFKTIVRPQVTTWYRLAWGDARAGQAKITVAARVSAVVTPGAVQGTLRPAAPGAPVQLQEQKDTGGWRILSSTTADPASGWSFPAALAPGTYRVRAAPGHGVAAGVTAPFTVQ